jgi:hypothetical protein
LAIAPAKNPNAHQQAPSNMSRGATKRALIKVTRERSNPQIAGAAQGLQNRFILDPEILIVAADSILPVFPEGAYLSAWAAAS